MRISGGRKKQRAAAVANKFVKTRARKNKNFSKVSKKWVRKRPMTWKKKMPQIVCPPEPKVSVVIPAMNEHRTISQVIYNAYRVHNATEVIVVVNGSNDATESIARNMGARVITYQLPLGHDVGRSIGARAAKGNIILFVDGDFVIPTADLIPFVKAVEKGQDIALNSYMGPVNKTHAHNVIIAKHALNMALSRPDLRGASLTTIPHAMNRKALDSIGIDNLAVPPIAQAIAIHKGLKVSPVHFIHVGMKNPRRRIIAGKDPLEKLIVGDHLEAIHWLICHTNKRAHRTDLARLREVVRECESS